MFKYPHIEQFRNVIRHVANKARFIGLNENSDPIFDETISLPILKFIGTTKLHGTNSSVVIMNDGSVSAQSSNESGLNEKEVGKVCSKKVKDWFFKNTQFNLK